jgi:hypothetical protein
MSNRELGRLARTDRLGEVLLRMRLDPLVVRIGAKMGVTAADIGEFGPEPEPAGAPPVGGAASDAAVGAEALRLAKRAGITPEDLARYGQE